VKLLVGSLCLELLAEDLVAIEELGDLAQSLSNFGIVVRASFRRPVRVLEVCPAWPYADLVRGSRRTFASASRPWSPMPPRSTKYREMERQFIQKHGLEDTDTEP
jgi:hypothetical protein